MAPGPSGDYFSQTWRQRDLMRIFGSRGNQGVYGITAPGVQTETISIYLYKQTFADFEWAYVAAAEAEAKKFRDALGFYEKSLKVDEVVRGAGHVLTKQTRMAVNRLGDLVRGR